MKIADPHSVYMFTNRAFMIFDSNGEQIPHYQKHITSYRLNKKVAQEVAKKAQKFYLSCFREWRHQITRQEFQYLLGLRTRQMDIAALDAAKEE